MAARVRVGDGEADVGLDACWRERSAVVVVDVDSVEPVVHVEDHSPGGRVFGGEGGGGHDVAVRLGLARCVEDLASVLLHPDARLRGFRMDFLPAMISVDEMIEGICIRTAPTFP